MLGYIQCDNNESEWMVAIIFFTRIQVSLINLDVYDCLILTHVFVSRYFQRMFQGASEFNGDMSNWNVANVGDMTVSR